MNVYGDSHAFLHAEVPVVFLEQDNLLITSGNDGRIVSWNLDPAFWVEKACQKARRNLTEQEWKTYLPDDEYRPSCVPFGDG
jgi:hypothetical protein